MSEIKGSPEEKRAEAERIVRDIIPQAKCELHDYEHRIRCGLVDSDGEKKEFSLLLDDLEQDVLEMHARALKERLS